jgi:hypothetical protein
VHPRRSELLRLRVLQNLVEVVRLIHEFQFYTPGALTYGESNAMGQCRGAACEGKLRFAQAQLP